MGKTEGPLRSVIVSAEQKAHGTAATKDGTRSHTNEDIMNTKTILCVAMAALVAAQMASYTSAQVDLSILNEALLAQGNDLAGEFFCADGTSNGFIELLDDNTGSGPLNVLINSIFGLGMEQGYRLATVSNGPLSQLLSGC